MCFTRNKPLAGNIRITQTHIHSNTIIGVPLSKSICRTRPRTHQRTNACFILDNRIRSHTKHIAMDSLTDRVRNERILSDFFIDASHELSLFAWNNGRGHKLTRAPYFCAARRPTLLASASHTDNGCAIYFDGGGGGDVSAVNDDISVRSTTPATSSSKPTVATVRISTIYGNRTKNKKTTTNPMWCQSSEVYKY